MINLDIFLDNIIQISNNDKGILESVNKVREDPSNYDSLKNLAYILLEKKYYNQANILYDYILEIFPSSTSIFYNKGKTLFNLEQYEKSIFYFDKVIESNQDDIADAYTSKAIALEYLDRYDEAQKYNALASKKYSEKIKIPSNY